MAGWKKKKKGSKSIDGWKKIVNENEIEKERKNERINEGKRIEQKIMVGKKGSKCIDY